MWVRCHAKCCLPFADNDENLTFALSCSHQTLDSPTMKHSPNNTLAPVAQLASLMAACVLLGACGGGGSESPDRSSQAVTPSMPVAASAAASDAASASSTALAAEGTAEAAGSASAPTASTSASATVSTIAAAPTSTTTAATTPSTGQAAASLTPLPSTTVPTLSGAVIAATSPPTSNVIAPSQTINTETPSTPQRTAAAALQTPFDVWSGLVTGRHVSEAYASRNVSDLQSSWVGPDGKTVQLVVRQPVIPVSATTVEIAPIATSADARPIFEAALLKAKSTGAKRLLIKPGVYNFRTLEAKARGHLAIEGLQDFEINGTGATLKFLANAHGLWVEQSQRLRISGLTLDYQLRSTSIGKIQARTGGRVLVVDPRYPITAQNKIYQIMEVDPATGIFVPGGGRVMIPPDTTEPATLIEPQTYRSTLFERFKLKDGASFMMLHNWYGGVAIKIDGSRNAQQTEDLTLSRITINSVPGMAITVTGMKRGLAIIDSIFKAPEHGDNFGGAEWDGIHVHQGGGDLLIKGNQFRNMGDDAINISNPVHPVEAINASAKTMIISNSARFLAQNDTLAFFDIQGTLIGTAKIMSKPVWIAETRHTVEVDQIPAGVQIGTKVRNVNLISSRYEVSGNLIEKCSCHGILAQTPNGLIEGNTIRQINRNPIRLLTSVTLWNEGSGAFNVAVRKNTIDTTGFDDALDVPWSAISVYGEANSKMFAAGLYANQDVEISQNTLRGLRQGCVTLASTRRAKISGNSCSAASTLSRLTAASGAAPPAINILRSTEVTQD